MVKKGVSLDNLILTSLILKMNFSVTAENIYSHSTILSH